MLFLDDDAFFFYSPSASVLFTTSTSFRGRVFFEKGKEEGL